jgi:hypothetical protein
VPNWSNCTLTVTGSKQAVAAFVKAAVGFDRVYARNEVEKRALMLRYQGTPPEPQQELLCFNALKPVPQDILDAGFDPMGKQWEEKHWGCKWGALDIKRQLPAMSKGAKAVYKFRTPNSAPAPLFDTVASNHPMLKLVLVVKYEGGGTTTTTWNKGERE